MSNSTYILTRVTLRFNALSRPFFLSPRPLIVPEYIHTTVLSAPCRLLIRFTRSRDGNSCGRPRTMEKRMYYPRIYTCSAVDRNNSVSSAAYSFLRPTRADWQREFFVWSVRWRKIIRNFNWNVFSRRVWEELFRFGLSSRRCLSRNWFYVCKIADINGLIASFDHRRDLWRVIINLKVT